jgi:hypothetical protein
MPIVHLIHRILARSISIEDYAQTFLKTSATANSQNVDENVYSVLLGFSPHECKRTDIIHTGEIQ